MVRLNGYFKYFRDISKFIFACKFQAICFVSCRTILLTAPVILQRTLFKTTKCDLWNRFKVNYRNNKRVNSNIYNSWKIFTHSHFLSYTCTCSIEIYNYWFTISTLSFDIVIVIELLNVNILVPIIFPINSSKRSTSQLILYIGPENIVVSVTVFICQRYITFCII